MDTKTIIRHIIKEELRTRLSEELTKKDFIQMARLIRQSAPQYHEALTEFAVTLAKTQNPRFDEARFREAVKSGKGI